MKFKSPTIFMIALAFTGMLLQAWLHPDPGLSQEYRHGVVTTNVNLRKTPGLQGDIVAGLQKGLPVRIFGEKDGWYRVSAKKNYIQFNGWVYNRYVEIVSPETAGSRPEMTSPRSLTAGEQPTQATIIPPSPKPVTPVRSQPAPMNIPAESAAPANAGSTAPPAGKQKSAAAEQTRPVSEKHSGTTAPDIPAVTADGSPATGGIRLLLSISPLVLAIIALLVAVRAFRASRSPAAEDTPPALPGEPETPDAPPTINPGRPPVNEKRRAPRLNRLVEVDFAVGGKFYRGFINNLSETGAYVDTPEQFTVGSEITISCPAIETGGYVKRDGMIVRLTETGIAVHFQQSVLP